MRIKTTGAVTALILAGTLAAAGCGSNSSAGSSGSGSGSGTSASGTSASGTSASGTSASGTSASGTSASGTSASGTSGSGVTASSFNNSFSALAGLSSLASKGKGKIAIILPDTTSSARYVEFDAPYLKEAAAKAGLPASDIIVQNAQGSDATALTDATSDITNGASVIAIDPEDPAGGLSVTKYANAHGVKVIDYDRLTLGSNAPYYVSFNNVQVGKLIGQGFVSCANAWHVSKPDVIVMRGAPTDNNATLFYQGYNSVLSPLFKSGKYTDAANPAGTWTPSVALSEFQQAYTAHNGVNSAVIPNDENGAPIISYLKTQGVKANSFPTTGQDATLVGLQNILTGYQCGTVYKPVYDEAEATIALALYLRAGQTPPSGLTNGTTEDTTAHKAIPSVLLTPEWVTPQNMKSTIVADKFVPVSQLCAGSVASECSKYGIK